MLADPPASSLGALGGSLPPEVAPYSRLDLGSRRLSADLQLALLCHITSIATPGQAHQPYAVRRPSYTLSGWRTRDWVSLCMVWCGVALSLPPAAAAAWACWRAFSAS